MSKPEKRGLVAQVDELNELVDLPRRRPSQPYKFRDTPKEAYILPKDFKGAPPRRSFLSPKTGSIKK